MVPEVPIHVRGLARLGHNFNTFFQLGRLECPRVLTILRVASGKPRRRMTVGNSDFARCTLNEIIDSDDLDLGCAMVLHRLRMAARPLCRLAHYVILLLLLEHLL